MTPKELSEIEYDVHLADVDSLLYKAAATGTVVEYTLYNQFGEVAHVDSTAKGCKDHMKDIEEFMGEDTSNWTIERTEDYRDVSYCYKVIDNMKDNLQKAVKAKRHIFFIGDGPNFRDKVATIQPYKGNRDALVKPFHFDDVKEYFKRQPDVVTITDGYEVDDIVSQNLHTDFVKNGTNPKRVLSHVDKDLRNTAGAHYNYNTGEWEWITQEQADYNFALQMLTGDKVDNIKGLPDIPVEFREKFKLPKRKGVGPATAKVILQDLEGQPLQVLYERVLEAYEAHYGTGTFTYQSHTGETLERTAEDILDENAELLYMIRIPKEHWPDYKKRTFK